MPKSGDDIIACDVAADVKVSMSLADIVCDSLNVGAALLDGDGRYVAVNKHYATLMDEGDAGSLIGKSHFEVCKSFLSRLEFDEVCSGTPLHEQLAEMGVVDTSKAKHILRWTAIPMHENGFACLLALRFVEQLQDEMKQLLRDRDQLRFAVEGADYGLWDWNVSTGEVFFSRQYMNMLGYEHYELPHTYETWALFCKPEDFIPYDDAVQDYMSAGDGFLEDEFQMLCKDGSLLWVQSRGKVVSRDSNGRALRIVGTHQDISLKKEHESSLIKAKEEAVSANQAKSDFLALISHEVRTPLNAITSVLQLLGDEDEAAERKRLSKIALNSSDQLLTVLSDVLDVSKMEAGRFDLSPKAVNLTDLVDELSQTHKKSIEAKGLSFNVFVNGDSEIYLMIDQVRLTQIINNFLSNATKFTERGEIALSVDIDSDYSKTHSSMVYLSFAVRDDGIGLSPSEREKLFQPFYQVEGARTRSSEGTGLGLSICKKLAGLMGGKVWCASKKGRGSTFYFEAAFPLAETAADDEKYEEKNTFDLSRDEIRVLAAEDNPVNQMMLKKFLQERMGYQLTVVSNGDEVMSALGDSEYDIILMDIHMPVRDGVSTTKEIRELGDALCDIPIVALTADATQSHVAEYKEVGIDECVSKPVDWQHLDIVIQKMLQQGRQ